MKIAEQGDIIDHNYQMIVDSEMKMSQVRREKSKKKKQHRENDETEISSNRE
jgi:hypothetical protein